jgi:hypothetical protein
VSGFPPFAPEDRKGVPKRALRLPSRFPIPAAVLTVPQDCHLVLQLRWSIFGASHCPGGGGCRYSAPMDGVWVTRRRHCHRSTGHVCSYASLP